MTGWTRTSYSAFTERWLDYFAFRHMDHGAGIEPAFWVPKAHVLPIRRSLNIRDFAGLDVGRSSYC